MTTLTPASASASASVNLSASVPISTPGATLSRPPHTRTISHTLGPLATSPMNAANRISRRKSVNSGSQANIAAVAAAMDAASPLAMPGPSSKHFMAAASVSLSSSVGRTGLGIPPTPPGSLPLAKFMPEVKRESTETAEDENSETMLDASSIRASSSDPTLLDDEKARLRQSSDGQPLVREGGKRFNRVELRCDTCGKSYKHSSCLTKHMWEHTPEWSYTSKLLISKHQQVQLLEAASVLLTMNHNDPKAEDAASPPDLMRDIVSESDSASDSASNRHDRTSSIETTPPPHMDSLGIKSTSYQLSTKRHSTGGISKAYKSAGAHRPSVNILQSIASSPTNTIVGSSHGRKRSEDIRPTSSGRNSTGKDDRELAAAVELLSCSFNSSKCKSPRPIAQSVPRLPVHYLEQATSFASSGFLSSFPSRQPESFTRGESFLRGSKRLAADDMHIDDSSSESGATMADDDDYDMHRARSDEDEEGVFGRME
ncbi:hypothetical protein TD95_003722 [Thielaviopsis punctulata]|uniref:C2H2-type domain-containing protein n=1 Tax=Thielaviopsis punctulata TaxID=72032 RepID=A0A0F4ZDA8_9PEZI|nr:hypothetical protein TD95_003722 [Thielaviopsis punctulata]